MGQKLLEQLLSIVLCQRENLRTGAIEQAKLENNLLVDRIHEILGARGARKRPKKPDNHQPFTGNCERVIPATWEQWLRFPKGLYRGIAATYGVANQLEFVDNDKPQDVHKISCHAACHKGGMRLEGRYSLIPKTCVENLNRKDFETLCKAYDLNPSELLAPLGRAQKFTGSRHRRILDEFYQRVCPAQPEPAARPKTKADTTRTQANFPKDAPGLQELESLCKGMRFLESRSTEPPNQDEQHRGLPTYSFKFYCYVAETCQGGQGSRNKRLMGHAVATGCNYKFKYGSWTNFQQRHSGRSNPHLVAWLIHLAQGYQDNGVYTGTD